MNNFHQDDDQFPATQWSLVARLGMEDEEHRRKTLNHLLTRYLPAMRAHLLYHKGMHPENADDLLQDFVAKKILEKNLLGQADHERGRFRTFLLTALDRFQLNRLRDEQASKRSPGTRQVSIDADNGNEAWVEHTAVFDVFWARQVIDDALRRMCSMCETSGRPDLWQIFRLRVAAPILEAAEPIDYGELVQKFGFASPSQASNALITAKRMYARALREVISEYACDEAGIDTELMELHQALARSSMS